jgi:hypothetical protein
MNDLIAFERELDNITGGNNAGDDDNVVLEEGQQAAEVVTVEDAAQVAAENEEGVAELRRRLADREDDYARLQCIVTMYDATIQRQMGMIKHVGDKCLTLERLYCHE